MRHHDLTDLALFDFARRWKAAGAPQKPGRLAMAWDWLLSLAPHRDRASAGQPEAKAPLCDCGRRGEVVACAECLTDVIRERLAELTPHEVLAMARGAALRDGERHLAKVLHAVLLLDLLGGLEDVAASCDKALVAIQHGLEHEQAGRVH